MIKSQNEAILNYLKKGNSITQLEALNKFDCFRLGARIYDLRKQGHVIVSKTIKNEKKGKAYAQYELVKEAVRAV